MGKVHSRVFLQGLRDALRDFRRQSNGQLSGEIDARSRATGELEAALGQVREKDKAVAAANAEVVQLQKQLEVGVTNSGKFILVPGPFSYYSGWKRKDR